MNSIRQILLLLTFLLLIASCVYGEDHLLLQKPAISHTQIVFAYAGDLWTVSREGGSASRLTTGVGIETDPAFSPDGKWIAFTGQYDGNTDVYVISSGGGVPRRLTFHPGADQVVGWTPDGKRVLFRSSRSSISGYNRLFTVAVEGGFPEEVPLPLAYEGSYSPDGLRIAYQPLTRWQPDWKRYRGGQTAPIWIARLSDSTIERLPRENSNDFNPMWIGGKIYFLSDRSGAVSLYCYDTDSKQVKQLVQNSGLDIKSASAGPDAIVYEQFGRIHLYDLKSGKETAVDISVAGDMIGVRPHFERVGTRINHADISPTGARAVFEARGEIITVPAEKGDARNLTRTTAVMERDASWSRDGKWIAYFSDESGEYALHVIDQAGAGPAKKISLGNPPSFFYGPTWSPDSKKIAFTDKRLNIWYADVEQGTTVKVDTDRFDDPSVVINLSWSPDSKWLTYSKFLDRHLRAIFVYSLETRKVSQITESLGDARFPVFDKNGKTLYFTASTDVGLSSGWLDLSSYQHPVLRSVY